VPRTLGSQLGLLRYVPGFRLLFLATLGSGIGTWLALVALQGDIFERPHSPAWITALLVADLRPMFTIGLLAGPLVDRLSRKRLMVYSDLVRFGAFCALPFTHSPAQIVGLAAVFVSPWRRSIQLPPRMERRLFGSRRLLPTKRRKLRTEIVGKTAVGHILSVTM